MSEIERAIEIINDSINYMRTHYGKRTTIEAYETALTALCAELDRERNEPKTCDGCKTWDIAKEHPLQIKQCSECSRQNGRTDRYEPKGEPPCTKD